MAETYSERKDHLWEAKVHVGTQTSSWMTLKTNIYPRTLNHVLSYYQFFDDISMLWTESEAELKAFFEQIIKIHSTIKFDNKYSYEIIEFLDTLVFKNNRNSLSLSTKLYSKPTYTSYYLSSKITNPEYSIWTSLESQTNMC